MTPYLLVDFGTTSTKSALVDLDTGLFSHEGRYPALPRVAGPAGQFEISLEALGRRFRQICADGHARAPLEGILLCSEMHGFALLDESGRPLSNYISWKDERSLERVAGQDTFGLIARELGPAFKALTGMRPRPGFPLMNAAHLGRCQRLPERVRLVSLPCWLAGAEGAAAGMHPTMLAGLAVYDLGRGEVAAELLALLRQLTGVSFGVAAPAPASQIAGYWRHERGRVPVYVGVGDHQCAVLGAANLPGQTLSLNLGTGSQVSVIDGRATAPELETRPYFDTHLLQTITHIPAGRALATHLDFLGQVRGGADSREFWAMLAALDQAALDQASLGFGLSLFKSARGYDGGGSISRIEEGQYTLPNYLASLLGAFLDQYLEVRDLLDPDHLLRRAVLSGGLARNLPRLHQLFGQRAACEALPATTVDETLLGLRTLALVAAGRAASCLEAQEVFGRQCRFSDT